MDARCWLMAAGLLATTMGCGTQEAPRPGAEAPAVLGEASPGVVRVGESVEFTMHVHCGVESTRFNGRVWNAVDPLYSSPEKLGPPAGWGNPTQQGTLTLESADRAVFAAVGQEVVLRPSENGEPLRPCD